MSRKARKRFTKNQLRYSGEGIRQIAEAQPMPGPSLIAVHPTGDQVQRIEFNFGLILARYGAQLHGVDFATDKVILHCQPGSQEAYTLENARVIENLVDTGLIPGETSVPGEAPSPTPSVSTAEPKVGEGAESEKPKVEPMSPEDAVRWATLS